MVIPKIIHQIWIGPKPVPTIWTDNIKNVAIQLGYSYQLWREPDIDVFDLQLRNIYDACEELYGKADIARYEILQRLGGIYIDADSVCVNIKAFERLLKIVEQSRATAFIGFEPPSKAAARFELIANGVIGTTPRSTFIEACYQEVKKRFYAYGETWAGIPPWQRTGPKLTTKIVETLGRYTQTSTLEFVAFITKIGPQRVLLLHDHVFYPESWHGISSVTLPDVTFDVSTILYQFGYSTNNLDEAMHDHPDLKLAYFINLEHRTDRLKECKRQLRSHFNLRRIDAVRDTNGAFGCLQSHIKALNILKDHPDRWMITVFEDDFDPIPDFAKRWKPIEIELQNNHDWEVAILAPSGYGGLHLTGDIVAPHLISGTGYSLAMVCYSQLFVKRRLAKLQALSVDDFTPIDVWISDHVREPGACLLPFETLGSQRPSHSDIENIHTDYTNLFSKVNEKLFELWSVCLFRR